MLLCFDWMIKLYPISVLQEKCDNKSLVLHCFSCILLWILAFDGILKVLKNLKSFIPFSVPECGENVGYTLKV